jgi:hypothetical protein
MSTFLPYATILSRSLKAMKIVNQEIENIKNNIYKQTKKLNRFTGKDNEINGD